MGAPVTLSSDTCGEVQYPPSNNVEEYIHLHIPRIAPRWFAIMPSEDGFAMRATLEKQGTALACSFKRWNRWGGGRDSTVEKHVDFTDTPFIRSCKEVAYEGQLALLITRLLIDAIVRDGVSFDL